MTSFSRGPRLIERFAAVCCISLALATVLILAVQRLDRESLPRSIEIAFPENRLLEETVHNAEAPRQLLQAGVTTLFRVPYTLDDMLRYGLAQAWHPEPRIMEIHLADNRLTSQATVFLTGQFGMNSLQIRLRDAEYICDITLPETMTMVAPERIILEIPAGPMPAGFRKGLFLPVGDWGVTRDLNQFTQAIFSLQPDCVMPNWQGGGHADYFFRSYLNTPWLRKPVLAIPEFSLPTLAKRIIRRQTRRTVIIAHYVSRQEAAQYSPEQLQQRLVRAARERNVSLLYLEPPKVWSFASQLVFYQGLRAKLQQAGFQVGAASKPTLMLTSQAATMLVYLGLMGIVFLFLWELGLWAAGVTGKDESLDKVLIIRLKAAHFRTAASFFMLALLIIHWEGPGAWGIKLAAWLLAVLVPLLALMLFAQDHPVRSATWQQRVVPSFREFMTITLWSFLAGLAISVLLYQPAFVQRWDGFFGVKAAYVVPWLAAGIYLFPGVTDPVWWKLRLAPGQRYWTLGTLLAIGCILALLLIRSGNHDWLPISSWELRWRDVLEGIMGARPRWKEFLLGHPLLLLGLYGRRLPGNPERVWPEVCVWLGFVGQISLINTFCHLHTPLVLSLQRTGHGLWLGILTGLLATALIRERKQAGE